MSSLSETINDKIFIYHSKKQSILKISGSDRIRYFHGRVTNNIKALKLGETIDSLVLTPQGKIQGKFLITAYSDFLLLISDPFYSKEQEEQFIAALLQFKVADDVVIENLSDSHSLIQAIGSKSATHFRELEIDQDIFKISFTLGKTPCLSLIVPDNKLEAFRKEISQTGLTQLTEEEFNLLRVKEAVPLMHLDLSDKILGPEIEVEKYVSFTKGCYAGQEVVEMSTARGRPNRKLVLLQAQANEQIKPGSEIFCPSKGEKACGFITSKAREENKDYYLGFIKTDFLEASDFSAEEISLSLVK